MTQIRREIQQYFALGSKHGAYIISSLGKDDIAWVYRNGIEYGVLVPYDGEQVAASFSSVELTTETLIIEGEKRGQYLYLSSNIKNYRNEFALVCESFVSPDNRKEIQRNPILWWEKWKGLLGNVQRDRMVYDFVGELLALDKLYAEGKNPFWSAIHRSSHDIETEEMAFEVKSTITKESSTIRVSNQFQLDRERPLILLFTRLEESMEGQSIEDLMNSISSRGCEHIVAYNKYLEESGYGVGSQERKQKYKLLERRWIEVDEHFPKITAEMFKGNKIPDNICHIEYDISLDGMKYNDWK